jgi:hypothetical protein
MASHDRGIAAGMYMNHIIYVSAVRAMPATASGRQPALTG